MTDDRPTKSDLYEARREVIQALRALVKDTADGKTAINRSIILRNAAAAIADLERATVERIATQYSLMQGRR